MKTRIQRSPAAALASAVLCLAVPSSGAGQAPVPPSAPDSTRLMAALAFLSADDLQGRATGTDGNAQARAFVVDAFDEVGLETFPSGRESPFEFSGRRGAGSGVNVLGWVRGTEHPGRYMVVTAHYDHVGVRRGEIYNGADDNASGTAALIEIAHALKAQPPRNSVILVALDAEEVGLRGARAFVAAPPVSLEAVALNVNMDMVGWVTAFCGQEAPIMPRPWPPSWRPWQPRHP